MGKLSAAPDLPPSTSPDADDLTPLLAVLPTHLRAVIEGLEANETLVEVVLDLGRVPEARLAPGRSVDLDSEPVTRAHIDHVVEHAGRFGRDNRAGIERTLHRISAMRNRDGDIIGLTCRVGRAVVGTLEIVRDTVLSGRSVLLLGRPGVGKTTLLREAARMLADDAGKRVVIVDTSNEIAGDGDLPHPGIGRARRMQVPSPDAQHAVMIEAVENHMPEVVVIDEIGTGAEALAARTIAERGVQLIATAHGNALDNLLQNPTLADLVGGVQTVILSDEEARRRGSQKTVPERRSPPTFDVLIEIRERDLLAVYPHVAAAVDARLRNIDAQPELRRRAADGSVEIVQLAAKPAPQSQSRGRSGSPYGDHGSDPYRSYPSNGDRNERAPRDHGSFENGPQGGSTNGSPAAETRVHPVRRTKHARTLRILPFAVDRRRLERAIHHLGARARVVENLEEADLVLTIKAQDRRGPRRLKDAHRHGVPVAVLKSNTPAQIESFLRRELDLDRRDLEASKRIAPEVQSAINRALDSGHPVSLEPQAGNLRRLQHVMIGDAGLRSGSQGQEPFRRVVIYPG